MVARITHSTGRRDSRTRLSAMMLLLRDESSVQHDKRGPRYTAIFNKQATRGHTSNRARTQHLKSFLNGRPRASCRARVSFVVSFVVHDKKKRNLLSHARILRIECAALNRQCSNICGFLKFLRGLQRSSFCSEQKFLRRPKSTPGGCAFRFRRSSRSSTFDTHLSHKKRCLQV